MIIHIYDSGVMSAFVENKLFLICILLNNLTPWNNTVLNKTDYKRKIRNVFG